jgi:hypothetical protein
MEKRRDPRLPLEYFTVDASDGAGFFQGAMENVSRFGICIKDLPKRLNNKAKEIVIVVTGNGRASSGDMILNFQHKHSADKPQMFVWLTLPE